MDVFHLGFNKTCNTTSHSTLMDKLRKCRLNKWTVRWIDNYLTCQTQRVVISTKSTWRPVPNGIPLRWILRPKLFNVVINDLDDESEWPLRKHVNDPKVRGVVGSPDG